jgi:hypothetical protein
MPRSVYRAVRYRDEMKKGWDSCIAAAKNGNFLFFRDYMDYHRDRFDDHSLMFTRDERVIACLPAHRTDDVLSSHRGLTFGGLIMDATIRLPHVAAIFGVLIDHMNANELRTLYYRAMPHPYHHLPAEEDLFVLSGLGARAIETKVTAVVPAGQPALYSGGRRRGIAHAWRKGLVTTRSFDFVRFMELCNDYLRRRRGATPVHSGEELQRLADRFPDNIQLYVIEQDSQLAGGVVVYRNATCVRAQYVAQSLDGQKLHAGIAIHDHILNEVLPAGTMLDFGHSTDPVTGSHDEELHAFKEYFGARAIQLSSYQLSIG